MPSMCMFASAYIHMWAHTCTRKWHPPTHTDVYMSTRTQHIVHNKLPKDVADHFLVSFETSCTLALMWSLCWEQILSHNLSLLTGYQMLPVYPSTTQPSTARTHKVTVKTCQLFDVHIDFFPIKRMSDNERFAPH